MLKCNAPPSDKPAFERWKRCDGISRVFAACDSFGRFGGGANDEAYALFCSTTRELVRTSAFTLHAPFWWEVCDCVTVCVCVRVEEEWKRVLERFGTTRGVRKSTSLSIEEAIDAVVIRLLATHPR